jgi:hypothetical protein
MIRVNVGPSCQLAEKKKKTEREKGKLAIAALGRSRPLRSCVHGNVHGRGSVVSFPSYIYVS